MVLVQYLYQKRISEGRRRPVTKILVRGKNGPADRFWSTKIGPNLVAKIGPARPKMVRCRIPIEFIATKCRKWCDHTLDINVQQVRSCVAVMHYNHEL